MLYTVDRVKITNMPHKKDFDTWRGHLSDVDYQKVMSELSNVLDRGEVHVSSFIPGSDWTDTVYEPIYHACDDDDELAAFFFGLLVWQAVQNHPADWSFQKYNDQRGYDIKGMVYFRIELPKELHF